MEEASREAFDDRTKARVFQELGLKVEEWRDLGGFESFVFAHDKARRILRITHINHRTEEDIQAELEFLRFLSDQGSSVCGASPPKRLIERCIGDSHR